MKLVLWLSMVLALNTIYVFSNENESLTQTIKGSVFNQKTQLPLNRVTVSIEGTKLGAISKADGSFKILKAPIGRCQIKFSMLGYESQIQNIVVTSGKEVVMNVQMIEAYIKTEEVTVSAKKSANEAINESAIVSSIQFSVDDAQRYAGSRMDPARMAQNFAGVLGANDTRNDIVIRGGSPTELLWKLDGLDIQNPNHFATQGATGGPVSAINTALLDNSDFMTGAFPAEYGDKLSGVFDLKTRKGNNENYEFMGQFGFNGLELLGEGPITSTSSFIVNYRYSFMGILESMGVDFGFSGVPYYQDASFKYDWSINSNNQVSLTALVGTSDIHIQESKNEDVYTGDFDIKNGTDLIGVIANWQHIFSEQLYGKFSLGLTYTNFRTHLDSITTDVNQKVTALDNWFEENSKEGFYSGKYQLFFNPSVQHSITLGTELRSRFYEFNEKRFTVEYDGNELYKLIKDGSTLQSLSFVNWNWRVSEDLTANIGIHSQYLQVNSKQTFEPRFGLKWNFADNHSVNVGWGIHTQSLPIIIYFKETENEKLNFMQSIHYILGYNWAINENSFIKVETYYKDLSNVPVELNPSSWSFLNMGTSFGSVVYSTEQLLDKGTGKTYGAEFSYIKHFTDGYYLTATASYIRQSYKGSDNKERWGEFDNQFILNILAGYEYKVDNSFSIEFAGKYTIAGGGPYTPIDVTKSTQTNNTYYLDSEAYTLRKPDYSRLDLRIDFRQNFQSFSLISYISIENLLNQENVSMYRWNVRKKETETVNQLGVFPVGGFKIEF